MKKVLNGTLLNANVHGFLFLVILCFLASCAPDSSSSSGTGKPTISMSGSGQIHHVPFNGAEGILQYTHSLGSTPQDVFFVITSTNSSYSSSDTTITGNAAPNRQTSAYGSVSADFSEFLSDPDNPKTPQGVDSEGMILKDRPEILALGNQALSPADFDASDRVRLSSSRQLTAAVDSTNDFKDCYFSQTNDCTVVTIPATLRKKVDVSEDVILNLWVADDGWSSGCGKKYCMTQDMLDAYAERFLKEGSANDIYNWVTGLYGDPWGPHSNPNYIDASADQEIDILFYDIDGDNSDNGGVLGFFWSKDNAILNSSDTTNYTDISNERLMFYIDSVLAAHGGDDSSWDINDDWPSEIVSTLAHEFQHMIHFYQKAILRTEGTESNTWINEMCSMVAEDLVADKILINGPRGVKYDDYTAGSNGNKRGRLPWFNENNYYGLGLTTWYSNNYVYYSYAIAYSFGAYLARNYNGAELFGKIVQNGYTDYRAVISALSELGYSIDFYTLLKKWGAAYLLSDNLSAPSGYIYNSGGSFNSTKNSIQYRLGSINFYYYSPEPYVPSTGSSMTIQDHHPASNRFVQAGSNVTGSKTWTIDMPSGVYLTVVTKDSD